MDQKKIVGKDLQNPFFGRRSKKLYLHVLGCLYYAFLKAVFNKIALYTRGFGLSQNNEFEMHFGKFDKPIFFFFLS